MRGLRLGHNNGFLASLLLPFCIVTILAAAAADASASSTTPDSTKDRSSDQDQQQDPNRQWMNVGGPPYAIANANANANSAAFDTAWVLKDPTVRSFDVYSRPIRTLYSLAKDSGFGIVTDTDTMAVVGYEVDQVRIDPDTGDEVPVPITWAYNHHYMAFLLGGRRADGTEKERDERSPSNHMVKDRSWLFFSEANGGEMRKSFHIYPPGYAQLVRNPRSFSVTPMQIDTWNRELMEHTSRFVPPEDADADAVDRYLLPRSSRIRNLTEARYNPLVECPCSDRLDKTWGMTYAVAVAVAIAGNSDGIGIGGDDRRRLDNATECFGAALTLFPSTNATTHTISSAAANADADAKQNPHSVSTSASRCTAQLSADGSLDVVWNETKTNKHRDVAPTGSLLRYKASGDVWVGTTPVGSLINVTIAVNRTSKQAEITLRGPHWETTDGANANANASERWFAIGFGTDSMCLRMEADECTTGGPYAIVVLPPTPTDMAGRVVERKLDYHGPGRMLSPQDPTRGYVLEVLSNEIEYEEDDSDNGSDGVGPGNNSNAAATTKALRVGRNERETGTVAVQPRNRAKHGSKRARRVVRLRRPLDGPTPAHYSFADLSKPLPFILATGCPGSGGAFGQHCGHQSPDPLVWAEVGKRHEIVRDGVKGRIAGRPFRKQCQDEPYGDLIRQKNPTCAVQTYSGGLRCCIHGHSLLDSHQEIPWQDRVLEYRLKFRFYYQDYTEEKGSNTDPGGAGGAIDATSAATTTNPAAPPSHRELTRFYWQTEAGGDEYDVPECDHQGNQECVHAITSRWKVRDFLDGRDAREASGIELIYAAPHCHAPLCLSMELYNADTGKLLCLVKPTVGTGRSSDSDSDGNHDEPYDEEGFLAISPCLWSHGDNERDDNNDDSVLPRPDFLSLDTTLMSIKRANNTFPHTGEMASWQMRGVVVPSAGDEETA
eukprot:jgi/Psemu1/194397/e_gw1.157.89.1